MRRQAFAEDWGTDRSLVAQMLSPDVDGHEVPTKTWKSRLPRLIDCDQYHEHGHRMLVRALVSMKEHTLARRAHTLWARSRAELDIEVPTFTESI